MFYLKFWHIVGKEVTPFCVDVLNKGTNLEVLNSTSIVFIPNIPNPSTMVKFRPINLYNVLYKIIAKSIANRFQRVLGRCIDKSQSVFVQGRLILDNVQLVYELLHTFHQKRWGKEGLMALKLDMRKVYDMIK